MNASTFKVGLRSDNRNRDFPNTNQVHQLGYGKYKQTEKRYCGLFKGIHGCLAEQRSSEPFCICFNGHTVVQIIIFSVMTPCSPLRCFDVSEVFAAIIRKRLSYKVDGLAYAVSNKFLTK
jgi:hypothetical protein